MKNIYLHASRDADTAAPGSVFSESMLNQLRAEYAHIKGIDPMQPTYSKITKLLGGMTQEQLKQLSKANIKFISSLARNRVRDADPDPKTATLEQRKEIALRLLKEEKAKVTPSMPGRLSGQQVSYYRGRAKKRMLEMGYEWPT